ncbi:MAG: LCP family protein [Peptoniphilaceae bacterium]|nr:LCP family protein [Peptoniphilaceae bacterium]MDY6018378.1 LCP family protein [Anaerococcus sp.]
MRIKRFLASVLILLLVFFGSNKVLDMLQDKKNIENYGAYAAEKNKNQIVDNELLILLVGVDKNPDSDPGDFTRTDTIMLVKANTETGKVDMLSIPRDSRIKIRDEFTKANHAHAYGGIELTLQSLRNFLGIDIDYYAEVDYDAVVKIVDALGGVNYDVPEGINVKRGTYIDIKPGKNHLSGEEVLWYLRTRNIYINGDLGRVGTQQLFMKAMVDEIVKKSSKINLTTFIQTYLADVKTNVPLSIMINMATNIKKFSSANVKTYVVPGIPQMINETSYYIPNYEKTWQIVDKVFDKYKLKDWSKADSGYDEYFGYSYDGQLSEDSIKTENSLRPEGTKGEDTTKPIDETNFNYQNNPVPNGQVQNNQQQYEIHTYYEYKYPDGRVEYHDQPPEWYKEEESQGQTQEVEEAPPAEEVDQGDE